MNTHAIPPCGAVLRALVAQQHNTWLLNLCEFIDNAFDAKATRVDIQWSPSISSFSVEDNGNGSAKLEPFFQLGKHAAHESTEVGMFGVGGSMAHMWICQAEGRSRVSTVHDGVLRKGTCNWKAILDGESWKFESEHARAARDGEGGTKIAVAPCSKRIPDRGDRFDSLVREIGFTYAVALRAGSQIRIRRSPNDAWTLVTPWSLPKLEPGAVDISISVGKRTAKINAGVVPDGVPNPKAGLTYYFGRRAITTTSRGCGEYSTGRIAGTVELVGKDWPVTTNKNDFRDVDVSDALFAAVFDAIHPLLMTAKQRTMELNVEAMTQDLNSWLNGAIEDARAKRNKPSGRNPGAVAPKNTNARHTKAEKEQSGETFQSKRGCASRYIIDWHNFGVDDPKLGRWDAPKTVSLNVDHPWVADCKDRADAEALLAIAAVIIAEGDNAFRAAASLSLTSTDDTMSLAGNVLRRRMDAKVRTTAVGPWSSLEPSSERA